MSRFGKWLSLLLVTATSTFAQRQPRIGYVCPAGGQQGTTFEVIVAGQYLNNVTNAFVSGRGIQAIVLEHEPSLTPKQAGELRQHLQELRKAEKTPDVIKEITEIRKKLAAFERKRLTPAIAETVPVRITIASDAAPGAHEIRVGTPTGLSNPLVFQVGQLPEFSKPEPKIDEGAPIGKQSKDSKPRPPTAGTNEPPMMITLPAIVNGQILPGGVDRYHFVARRDQRVVVVASARDLIPYLADAVPGWFQATLALYDAQGKELAYADDYRFHPDPVLFYKIPKDGEYVLEIRDALYRGREDFVYRIAVGELPFVTGVFPLGGKAGTHTSVEIRGWNLPVSRLKLELEEPGTYSVFVRRDGRFSNRVPFAVDTLPECFEQEPNDSPSHAQPVTLPVIVNGRIDQPGDVDVFRFEGRAGDQIVAEIYARRLDSPLDSVLKLTDAAGKQLAFNDDHEDKGSGLNTHHADSYLTATLPADGTYYLHLWDAQHEGGWASSYRLRISSPRPDFNLRVVPSSLNARAGGNVPLTVFALRRDGFTNEVAIALKDAPAGFKLSGGPVPAGQDQVRLTLTAPATPPTNPVNLKLVGRAMIGGKEIIHPAVPAEDMMQAFAYRHLVPVEELKVAVASREPAKPPIQILSETPVRIPAGGTARVRVAAPPSMLAGNLQIELSQPPEGISVKEFSPSRDGVEIVLQCDAEAVKLGLKGNLIFQVFGQMPSATEKPPANKQRMLRGTLPAIAFEVIQP